MFFFFFFLISLYNKLYKNVISYVASRSDFCYKEQLFPVGEEWESFFMVTLITGDQFIFKLV